MPAKLLGMLVQPHKPLCSALLKPAHDRQPQQALLPQWLVCALQIANSNMERFWRLCNADVREVLQPRLPELRPSACEAMISGLQKL